ncbi:MAG: autotransporter-associated beta strand protein, partial [Pirellulaceae bacterium]
GTTVAAGATLQLEGGGVNVTGEDLVLTAELGNPATLENVSGDNTWTGAINASTPVVGEIQIVSLTIGDTLTIDGDVDLRESKLSVDGDGDTLIAGDIFSTSPIPTSFAEIGQLTDVDGTMQTISFQNTYTNPVIVAMASQRDAGTANLADDPNAAVVRVSNVDPVGGTFDIRLQSPSSGSTGFPVQETVNYIVIEAGEYVLDTGAVLKADTAVVTGNANQTINFAGSAFGATPIAISQIVSENNAAFVKARHRAGVNTASFTLFLEEAAGQTQHAASETVGYIAIEPTVGTTAGFLFEAGTTTNSVTHAEFTVALANTYNSPPIFVADQQTIDGGDPGGSRFRYVGSDVTVFSDEDRSSDNETAHADEVFGYVAFDGTGIMRDGLVPDNQLMKMGDGTLILEGDNTYENGTAVLGGTLLANNTAGSATGTSNVQVDTAGTLGGTGTVAGAVNVDTGTIAPGNPTGTLSAANTTINATGTLDVEIGGNAAGLWDILAVTGGVNLNGPTLSASITNGFTTTPGEAFVIVSNDELEPITGEFAGLPEGGSLNLPGGGRFHITYIYDAGTGTEGNGNDIALIANNPPVAGQDGPMTIPEDVAINIAASGVLGNDSDSDAADTITAQLVTGPTNALSFTLNTDGSWNYTPNLHFSGADSFTYLATDGELDSNQITVDINILPVADAPSITLGASTITVPENSVIPLNIATALVDTDGSETLVTTLTGVPAIGTLSAGTESGGVYTLTSTQLVGLTLTMPDNLSADAAFTLTITATATEGVNNVAVSTDTIDITVNNVVPAASISGTTSTVPNFAVPYVVNVSDVGPTDQADGFDITIDWGDGTSDVFGPNSVGLINLNHSFAEFGNFDVTLTATDKDGGQTVYIHNVQVDPVAIIDRELFVGGTDAVNDRIIVQDAGRNSVYVRYNDIRYGSFDQTDFDVVRIFGGDGNDRVSVSGICLPAITELQEGRDAYFGGTCNDTVDGGSGRDIIQLGEGDNFADGGDDNDVITSRSGNDILRGGNGNDRLQPGAGDDIAFGDGGNDQIIGSRGNDLLVGGLGNDNLNGGDGHDVLVGGIGNDILRSGTGEDLAIGGVGNDGIRGDGGVDTITGAEGENEADEAALLSLLAGWTATRDRSAIGALLDDSDQDGLNGNGGADQIGIGVDDAVYSLRAADVLFSV